VVVVVVYAAICEASVTDGLKAVAKVVAGPVTAVAVVGVFVEPPGFCPLAFPPDAVARSPFFVGVVADGISVVNPVVFNPAGLLPVG
jgi:hypothetical protein